jgi:hypothetical protein
MPALLPHPPSIALPRHHRPTPDFTAVIETIFKRVLPPWLVGLAPSKLVSDDLAKIDPPSTISIVKRCFRLSKTVRLKIEKRHRLSLAVCPTANDKNGCKKLEQYLLAAIGDG